jgi:hypothetical protein
MYKTNPCNKYIPYDISPRNLAESVVNSPNIVLPQAIIENAKDSKIIGIKSYVVVYIFTVKIIAKIQINDAIGSRENFLNLSNRTSIADRIPPIKQKVLIMSKCNRSADRARQLKKI